MNTFYNFTRRYLFPYLWWYLAGFVCVYITQWLAVAIIDQTRQAVDAMAQNGIDKQTVMPFVYTILGMAVLVIIIRTASRLLVFTPGRMIEYHIRNDYYARLLMLQRDFLSKHESGDLVSRCSNDISYIRAAYGFGALQVGNVTITMVLVVMAMLKIDARTTLYLAIPMAVSMIVIQTSIRMLFRHWRLANQQLGEMSSMALSSYKGVAAIQNYHAEPAVEERFSEVNRKFLLSQEAITKNRSFAIPLVKLVGNFSMFVVLLVVGNKVIDGTLTPGQIAAFLGYIAMIMPPLLSLGWMLNVFSQAVPAIERLDEILLAEPSLLPSEAAPNLEAGKPVNVSIRGLGFKFPEPEGEGKPFALQDIELELTPGKIVGIVGSLGCGKTTFLDTLLRLNAPNPEQIYINGHDAVYVQLDEYRRHFSFAPQNVFLFSTTLRKNLMAALPAEEWDSVTDQRLIDALKFACFDLNPKQFPNGLETEVGEKGVMLSGGQRQRIALARALLKEASIYVLDDVLSAVDHETEKTIIANIRAYASGKTFVIASHRVSAIQWADEILVMDDGKIIDRGKHEALCERDGFYRDIYNYQSEHGEEAA